MDIKGLRKQLTKLVEPFYATNDKAHLLPHAHSVADNALYVAAMIDEHHPLDIKMAVMAAYLHDIFSDQRDNHHELAAKWVRDNSSMLMGMFGMSRVHIYQVADACAEHRASYTGEYSSVISEIVAAADRGNIDTLKSLLKRSYQYASSKEGLTDDEAKVHACEHMHEKYGMNGYARYPDVWKEAYGAKLTIVQLEIAMISRNPTPEEYDRLVA